ncbi:MAG: lysozyme [Xenococcus sp. MO_188.B8]|nr:lysozyme [Xenococcus sp. MO_188.B8]
MALKFITINNYSSRLLVALGAFLIIDKVFSPAVIAANNQSHIQENQITNVSFSLNNAIAAAPRVSPVAINLVKQYEGFRSYAYIDTNGLPVIGYGQSRIRGRKVRMGQYISRAEADAELAKELYRIQSLVASKVKVKLNPNQLAALTSLVYNAGFRVVTNSTLSRKLNAGNYAGAANEILRWNKAHQGGKLVPLAGLIKRRQAERQLFLTPYK